MFNLPQSTFGRRSFLRFSALSVAAGSFLMNPISKAVAQAVKEIEPFYWNACVINCGQRCPQRCLCARHERTLQGGSPEVQAVAPST